MLQAASATQSSVVQNLLLSAIQAYYQVQAGIAALDAALESERASEESYKAAEARYKAGVATPADKLQAQTLFAQNTLTRITAEGSLKNAYGLLMAKSTYQGTRALMNGERPFVLTRASYAGIQKYSAQWTGDNVSSDEHMMLGFRLLNSMGISGVPYVGMDIGGFIGNPSPELVALYNRYIAGEITLSTIRAEVERLYPQQPSTDPYPRYELPLSA